MNWYRLFTETDTASLLQNILRQNQELMHEMRLRRNEQESEEQENRCT